MKVRSGLAILALAALPGCGGGGSPTSPATPPAPASATLSVVSGETGQPVAGASVSVAGRALTTDASGRVTLPDRPPGATLVDVVAGGFLDRQTLLRDSTEFRLWPRESPTGLSEDFTANVVYTAASGDDPPLGDAPLERLRAGITGATVVAAPELWNDPAARRALEDAAGQVGVATEGAVVYAVAPERPAGTVFEARIDPSDSICAGGDTRGYFRGRYVGYEITGGEVVFCELGFARSATAAHELGHSLGLNHSSSSRDLMYGYFVRGRPTSLTPREGLAVRLMLQRRAGNRFPDNDRSAGASRAVRTRVTVCR